MSSEYLLYAKHCANYQHSEMWKMVIKFKEFNSVEEQRLVKNACLELEKRT